MSRPVCPINFLYDLYALAVWASHQALCYETNQKKKNQTKVEAC